MKRTDTGVQTAIESTETTKTTSIEETFAKLNQVNAIKKLKQGIHERKSAFVGESDVIEERLQQYTIDAIKNASPELVDEIFGDIDVHSIDFDTKKRKYEFKRDYLIFIKESEEASQTIDLELEKLEESMASEKDNIKKIFNEYGNMTGYIRKTLEDRIAGTEDETVKAKLGEVMAALNDSIILDRMYNHYKELGTKNILDDYRRRANSVYKRYLQVNKSLNLQTDFVKFTGFEVGHLEEKYHQYPDLFIFLVMRMYGYKKNELQKSVDGTFLSQVALQLRSIIYGQHDENDKDIEAFKNNVCRVLDLFID